MLVTIQCRTSTVDLKIRPDKMYHDFEKGIKSTLTDAVGQRIGGIVSPVDHGLGSVLVLAGVVHLLGVAPINSLA